jgi:MtN3 and saliva related transmembrane protein
VLVCALIVSSMPNFIDTVGWLAGGLTMLTTLPQLIKLIRTDDRRGVAMGTYGAWVATAAWWAVWSYQVAAWPSFVMNALCLIIDLIIVVRLRATARQWAAILAGTFGAVLLYPWVSLVLLGAMILQLWVALPTLRLVLRGEPLDGVSAVTWAVVLSSNVCWVVYMTGIGRPQATVVDVIAGICATVILVRLRGFRRTRTLPATPTGAVDDHGQTATLAV